MVEDIVTTGKSVRNAISIVEALCAKVVQVVCLVDRDEVGCEALHPYPLTSLFTRDEVEK